VEPGHARRRLNGQAVLGALVERIHQTPHAGIYGGSGLLERVRGGPFSVFIGLWSLLGVLRVAVQIDCVGPAGIVATLRAPP
jgi:hypothetical protein